MLQSKQKMPIDELLRRSRQTCSFVACDLDTPGGESLGLLQAPSLIPHAGLIHCFTTRHGGSSPAPYNTFNLGRNLPDDYLKSLALANRHLLLETLGLADVFDHLKVPSQVHSGNVLIVDADGARNESLDLSNLDGLVTNVVRTPLLLHFADCVPVMIFDPVRRVLGIVHAGWRGTAKAIAFRAAQYMVEQLDCKAEDMVAAVGPAIGTCCYPTGPEVESGLIDALAEVSNLSGHDIDMSEVARAACGPDGLIIRHESPQPRPDLKAFNALQLLSAGIETVDVSDLCTSCRPDLFFSHRQSGGLTGRQGALACLV